MAEGDITIYNNFKEQIMEGIFNLASGGDTVKVTLHAGGYTPNIDTHTVWTDVSATEYPTTDGYTAGGKTLSSQDVTQDDTDNEGVFDAADITWTALGPLTGTAIPTYAIIWDDTPTSPADPLIAYIELGVTTPNGGDYTITWNAEGILNLT